MIVFFESLLAGQCFILSNNDRLFICVLFHFKFINLFEINDVAVTSNAFLTPTNLLLRYGEIFVTTMKVKETATISSNYSS